eukprot:109414-Prymnesium_polylepis.2
MGCISAYESNACREQFPQMPTNGCKQRDAHVSLAVLPHSRAEREGEAHRAAEFRAAWHVYRGRRGGRPRVSHLSRCGTRGNETDVRNAVIEID